MALTPQEEQELAELEADPTLQGSVMFNPSTVQQVKQAVVESLPAMGGMVGGVLGAATTRTPIGARAGYGAGAAAIRSMIGAGLGGATGEAAAQAITGRPSAVSLLRGGIEQAAFDGLGNLIFSAGGKVFTIAKDRLMKSIPGPLPDDPVVAAQRILESEGGTLTPFQAKGNPWEGFKESVARGSFTGKPVFEEVEAKNIDAVTKAKTRILDEVSSRVYDSLQTGKEFAAAINEGDEALKSLTRPFYEALDKSPTIAQQAVNIKGIKERASSILAKSDATEGLTVSPKEAEYLQKFANLPDNIGFATAHDIASSLKTRLRDMKRTSEPDSAAVQQLTNLVVNIEKSMDAAGSKFAGTAIPFEGRLADDTTDNLAQQYRFYSKFYRDGIKDLYSDTASKLLDVNPEFVGKNIFKSGNVTAWQEATAALAKAKQLNPDLNVGETIKSVRRGYLEDLLKSESSFARLGDRLKNDETLRRTFEAILPAEQQTRVKTLLNAARLSEVKPSASAPLFFAAQQAQATGALLSVGSLVFSDQARNVALDNPVKTALFGSAILLGPRFWAKAATNPDATAEALKMLRATQTGTPITANAFLKMSNAFEKAGIAAEDLISGNTASGPGPLSPEEEAELERLEAELSRQ